MSLSRISGSGKRGSDRNLVLSGLRGQFGWGISSTFNSDVMRQPFGLPEVDAVLPGGGLHVACLHEIAGDVTAIGFVAALSNLFLRGNLGGDMVFWGRLSHEKFERGNLYASGLIAFGLNPERLILFEARDQKDLLWSMEEMLRSGVPSVVIGETGSTDFISSRRLQLAAKSGGVTVLLLNQSSSWNLVRSYPHVKKFSFLSTSNFNITSAAVTRWRVIPVPRYKAEIKSSCWRVELVYCKGAYPHTWFMEWQHENKLTGEKRFKSFAPDCFSLDAKFCN